MKIITESPKESLDTLRTQLHKAVFGYAITEGFQANEVDEYFFVDVNRVEDHIECEVRAEIDYDDLDKLCAKLNPIVQKYDPAAYFEPVQPGIIISYVYKNGSSKSLF